MVQNGRGGTRARPRWLTALAVLLWSLVPVQGALPRNLAAQLENIWTNERTLNESDVAALRQEAYDMFDKGFTNYMNLAFPKDNLLPISCKGEDWQGGLAVTLLDALDALMVFGRVSDMQVALPLIRRHVDFKKPVKVHFFEVVIRVVGGLLSGHSLLTRATDIIPEYDNSLLDLATELAEAMLPAFQSASGLPWMFVNLGTAPVMDIRTTCTACVGTLLMEYGTLSELTGDPRWRHLAEHAATALFKRRSSLGLVGTSLDVSTSTWVSREATIGPGSDSFYEYMLKSYLMFGNRTHLDMFVELYTATMRHLQMPGTLRGYAFLTDVNMDSGRVSRPFVSSLGAFWPGMQALIGQTQDAVDLHANFTAAWQTFGWLPESFTLDLERVHPEDPGYNLRPEHIESTYILHALTGNPRYQAVAAQMQRSLVAGSTAKCGYAAVANVETGAQQDLQESFFLSETVKYLYLTWTNHSQHILDYYVLSTEGHLFPTLVPTDALHEYQEEADLQQAVGQGVPPNCERLCRHTDNTQQSEIEQGLRQSFPLLAFRREEARVIKRRRCIACVAVTAHMKANPPKPNNSRMRIMQLTADIQTNGVLTPNKALAQLVCVLRVSRSGDCKCHVLRPLMPNDFQSGLPHNAVVLQLTWVEPTQRGLMVVAPINPADEASLYLRGGTTAFGPGLTELTPACRTQLFNTTWPWLRLSAESRHGVSHCRTHASLPTQYAKADDTLWDTAERYEGMTHTHTLSPLTMQGHHLAQEALRWQDTHAVCKIRSRHTPTEELTCAETDTQTTETTATPAPQPSADTPSAHPSADTLTPHASADTPVSHKGSEGPVSVGQGAPRTRPVITTTSVATVVVPAGTPLPNVSSVRVTARVPDTVTHDTMHASDQHTVTGSQNTGHAALSVTQTTNTSHATDSHANTTHSEVSATQLHTHTSSDTHQDSSALHHDTVPISDPSVSSECQVPDYLDQSLEAPQRHGACANVPVVWGELALSSPLDACGGTIHNSESLSGAIAVVLRGGGCSFVDKALEVQSAGALGMVVLDLHTHVNTEDITMTGDAGMLVNTVGIPSLLLNAWHSTLLVDALHRAAAQGAYRPVATLAAEPTSATQQRETQEGAARRRKPAALRGTTTVYMLIPNHSQLFVKASILDRGLTLETALNSVLEDERVPLMLMQIAKENEAAQQELRAQQQQRTRKT